MIKKKEFFLMNEILCFNQEPKMEIFPADLADFAEGIIEIILFFLMVFLPSSHFQTSKRLLLWSK